MASAAGSALGSSLAPLSGLLVPLRCMSVKALCSALSVASAGTSRLSSLSVDTFAQSVLQVQAGSRCPFVLSVGVRTVWRRYSRALPTQAYAVASRRHEPLRSPLNHAKVQATVTEVSRHGTPFQLVTLSNG